MKTITLEDQDWYDILHILSSDPINNIKYQKLFFKLKDKVYPEKKPKGFTKICYGCLDKYRIPEDVELFLCPKCKEKK